MSVEHDRALRSAVGLAVERARQLVVLIAVRHAQLGHAGSQSCDVCISAEVYRDAVVIAEWLDGRPIQ